ncbi:MAG TPA: helix-turn-helix domain-containing protein [Candidatus Baltobacteraceae bacterium]|jgi:DNA-binding HxlR family transcriptional regulator|nr:helix-turn-helix domain-containing protein [Candidatus Baltobacteraceae bacterium]
METIAKPVQKPVFERDCSIRLVLDRIADKWTVMIMHLLLDGGQHRFNVLRRAIEGISQKMLTQTLRDLERDGLVVRTVYPEIPPRVEYALTPLGLTLCGPINALGEWAREHYKEIERAQAAFDARP